MVNLEKIGIKRVEIPRKDAFKIATGTSYSVRNLVLKIVADGYEGLGAGAPTRVTGESIESIESALRVLQRRFTGKDFGSADEAIDEAEKYIGKHPSAMAAFDMAIFDIFSRMEEIPLYRYLSERYGGKIRKKIITDMTIGIGGIEKTVEEALKYRDKGFRALKIKIGLDFKEDMERISAIREAVGEEIMLWADANQGYSPDEGIEASANLRGNGYLFLEQPVKWDDFDGMKRIAEASEIPIFADESAKNIELAKEISKKNIADGINIKIMKFGGIRRSIEVIRIARKHRKKLMIGCMGEFSLSIAAGYHLAKAFSEIEYVDLDSFLMLDYDPGHGLEFHDGEIKNEGNGLGVILDEDYLEDIL